MKIRRQHHFQAEVATSSLNDIMFFLLLFFLIISTVTNPSIIKIMLPQSKAAQSMTKQPVTLTVTANKQYFINKQPVPFQDLESALLDACKGMSEPTVVLRLPYSLTVQDLVDVMQLSAKHKIKMVLATTKSK